MRKNLILLWSVFCVTIILDSQAQNWSALNGPTGGSVTKVATDAAGNIYALVTGNGSIYVSKNGGTTWSNVSAGLSYLHGFDIDSDGKTIYANAWSEFYVSTDAGVSWTKKNITLVQYANGGVRAMKESGILFIYGTFGAYVSADGGVFWKKIFDKDVSQVIHNKAGDILIASNEIGILKHSKPADFSGWDISKWTTVFANEVSGSDPNLSLGYHQPWEKYFITHKSVTTGQNVYKVSSNAGETWTTITEPVVSSQLASNWFSSIPQDKFIYTIGNTLYEVQNGTPVTFTLKSTPGYGRSGVVSVFFKSFTEIYAGLYDDGVRHDFLKAIDVLGRKRGEKLEILRITNTNLLISAKSLAELFVALMTATLSIMKRDEIKSFLQSIGYDENSESGPYRFIDNYRTQQQRVFSVQTKAGEVFMTTYSNTSYKLSLLNRLGQFMQINFIFFDHLFNEMIEEDEKI